ncbi:hypothetical protein C8R44DRAFT_847988 [Mycena epipterygia]|nr:hypothetical protein C8R44DRAFT_847988 [Mycena epipterygia]
MIPKINPCRNDGILAMNASRCSESLRFEKDGNPRDRAGIPEMDHKSKESIGCVGFVLGVIQQNSDNIPESELKMFTFPMLRSSDSSWRKGTGLKQELPAKAALRSPKEGPFITFSPNPAAHESVGCPMNPTALGGARLGRNIGWTRWDVWASLSTHAWIDRKIDSLASPVPVHLSTARRVVHSECGAVAIRSPAEEPVDLAPASGTRHHRLLNFNEVPLDSDLAVVKSTISKAREPLALVE